MKTVFVLVTAFVLLYMSSIAQTEITIDTVTVGDSENMADTELMDDGTTSYGSVGYTYYIGKYEVTAGQYTDFLNNKAKSDPYELYDTSMMDTTGCKIQRDGLSGSYTYSVASDWTNRPVNYISFWDSLRFVNWLNNDQGNGETEIGAYSLSGYNGDDGRTITRNANAKWFLPSEDEWYKAAYYKAGGTNAGYWDYQTQSDMYPDNQVTETDNGNNANYAWDGFAIGSPYYLTNVGEFENSASAYGTFDQAGNVWEWNETLIYIDGRRGVRGGSFGSNSAYMLTSRHRDYIGNPLVDHDIGNGGYTTGFGFRVATVVAEPSSLLALCGGVVGLLSFRRRRK